MNSNFKQRFWKTSQWFLASFVLLFAFRLAYGYLEGAAVSRNDLSDDFFSSIDDLRRNYASEKKVIKEGDVADASNMAASQKYEKTASVKSKTAAFEEDEKKIKSQARTFGAVIQYEQSLGQKGNRQIHLLIGVSPELFDSLYKVLQQIGTLKATEITKVDKTNEYRQLNAKKTSIEKTLVSLNELKSKAGAISDFVALNDKILEIEEKAQGLGVELGNFDSENEFCTVKYSLYEGATEKNISFIHRVKVALEWTIRQYAILIFTVFLISLTVFVMLLVIDKFKIINAINKKINE